MKRSLLTVFFLLFILIVVPACRKNDANIPGDTGPGGVRLGMTRMEVVQVMLDEVQLLQMSGQAANPYATRYVNDLRDEQLEIMYYYTGMKVPDDRVTEEELVPVILIDDSVVGWGWESLESMTGKRPAPGM